ncbi:hypothetical protein E4U30_005086 [Claviceps sp. LM220 group G6]|nr:hypothetical protein E4U30_005086 [Claviceps sp. LM220 group G6]
MSPLHLQVALRAGPYLRRLEVSASLGSRDSTYRVAATVVSSASWSTDLHEPDLRVCDHPPPPELLYESFKDALAGVTTWAKDHGDRVSFNKQRWDTGGRCRLLMTCYRRGKAKPREAGDHEAGESSVPRRRPGAVSQKTDCKMQFWLLTNDDTQPDGQWRVK